MTDYTWGDAQRWETGAVEVEMCACGHPADDHNLRDWPHACATAGCECGNRGAEVRSDRCVCGEAIEQHTPTGSYRAPVLMCPDGIHEFDLDVRDDPDGEDREARAQARAERAGFAGDYVMLDDVPDWAWRAVEPRRRDDR